MASLIQKMIFQQSSIRAALDEPQAPPLADATIWPNNYTKQQRQARTGQSLSVTPDKLHTLETRPLDLDGCQSRQVTRRTMLTIDHQPHPSTAEYISLTVRHANFASRSLIRRRTCRFSFNHLFWSPKQIILNVVFILNHDYTWHYKPGHSVLVRTCSI